MVRLRVDASSLITWLCRQVQCPWARLIVHPEKMCLRDADAQVFRGRLQIIHGSDRKTQSRSLHLPDIMPAEPFPLQALPVCPSPLLSHGDSFGMLLCFLLSPDFLYHKLSLLRSCSFVPQRTFGMSPRPALPCWIWPTTSLKSRLCPLNSF